MITIQPEIIRESEPPCCLHGDCNNDFICALIAAMTKSISSA